MLNCYIKPHLSTTAGSPAATACPQQIYKRLHNLYVDTTSNPFHRFGLPISSPRFDVHLEQIVAVYPKPGASLGGFMT